MNFWLLIGVGLIFWLAYDLYYGVTWTYRAVYKKSEPKLYVLVTVYWALLAITTLVSGLGWIS